MSYFLWVEDFENSPEVTATNVFGELFDSELFSNNKRELKRNFKDHGVLVELNLQDGLDVISSELDKKIDYIILDIDLPAYDGDLNQEVLGLLSEFEGYQTLDDEAEDEALRKQACHSLKSIAGFYLYTKLVVELGFPKQHILFCSNHGENTETIQNAFKAAKIKLPKIYQKSDVEVKNWVKDRYQNPYSRLRRGIIEGCKLAKKMANDDLYFNNYTFKQDNVQINDIISYFEVLEGFLPLREPDDKKSVYKLFIRTLSHEWEAAKKIKSSTDKLDAGLAWIMRNTRHWITHNSSLFEAVDEQLVAFLFMINMRTMFSFADYSQHNYEKILLKLFENESLSETDFSALNYRDSVGDAYLDLRTLIRDENQQSDNKKQSIEEVFYFNEMANNVQLSNRQLRNDKKLFIKLLYQMFWLMTCNPYVDKKNNRSLEIKFWNFNYSDKPYMLELARNIYHRSFPEA
jgi:hypothetical protein